MDGHACERAMARPQNVRERRPPGLPVAFVFHYFARSLVLSFDNRTHLTGRFARRPTRGAEEKSANLRYIFDVFFFDSFSSLRREQMSREAVAGAFGP